jgi:hypothetical protein
MEREELRRKTTARYILGAAAILAAFVLGFVALYIVIRVLVV